MLLRSENSLDVVKTGFFELAEHDRSSLLQYLQNDGISTRPGFVLLYFPELMYRISTNKVLSTVSATQGTPIHSRQYTNIDEILTTRLQDGKLLAVGVDGRLICLDPMR